MGSWIERNKEQLWFSAALNGVFLALCLLIFYPFFDTNDDMGLISLCSGLRGASDMRLVYMNCALGWVFCRLYETVQGVPWFSLVQYALLYCSLTAATWVLIRKLKHTSSLWLVLLFLLVFSYECYIRVQYTKSAGVMTAAGLSLLFYAVFQEKLPLLPWLGGLSLTLMGSLYRFNQFACETALFLPLGLFFLFSLFRAERKQRIGRFLRCAGTFMLAGVLALGAYGMDRAMYSDAGWEDFLRYDAARSELIDYGFPDYEKNEEAYLELGIDDSAYQLFRSWTHQDSEKITADVLESLVELKSNRKINLSFGKKFVQTIGKGILKISAFWVFAAMAAAWLLSGKKQVPEVLTFLAEAAFLTLLYGYLFYRGRYLFNRVDIGIWMAAAMVTAWLIRTEKPLPLKRAGAALFACAVLLSQCAWREHWRVSAQPAAEKAQQEERAVLEEIDRDDTHLYLAKASTLSFARAYGVWDGIPYGIGDNEYPLGGWTAQTATYRTVLERYGVKNPFRDMIGNDTVYLIDDKIDITLNYLRRWYDPGAEAEEVKTIGRYTVYRILAGN